MCLWRLKEKVLKAEIVCQEEQALYHVFLFWLFLRASLLQTEPCDFSLKHAFSTHFKVSVRGLLTCRAPGLCNGDRYLDSSTNKTKMNCMAKHHWRGFGGSWLFSYSVFCVLCSKMQGDTEPDILTSYIEVDQSLIFAGFVFGRALVHDGNTGVADLKPAHYLWDESVGKTLIHQEEARIR